MKTKSRNSRKQTRTKQREKDHIERKKKIERKDFDRKKIREKMGTILIKKNKIKDNDEKI